MQEIEREAVLPDGQRYNSVLSPPLFMALALLLGHAVATALGQTDKIIASHHGLADLINDNASALVLRVVVFAAFPLFLAARLVRRRGQKLDRTSLQQPFYEQCYPAAIFALGISVGTSLSIDTHPTARVVGHWLAASAILNFVAVEIWWFASVLKTVTCPPSVPRS